MYNLIQTSPTSPKKLKRISNDVLEVFAAAATDNLALLNRTEEQAQQILAESIRALEEAEVPGTANDVVLGLLHTNKNLDTKILEAYSGKHKANYDKFLRQEINEAEPYANDCCD